MKLKRSEIHKIRKQIQNQQNNCCAICGGSFDAATYSHKKKKIIPKYKPCLDHNHSFGYIRGVLCSGCNSVEGKIINGIKRYHPHVVTQDIPHLLKETARYLEEHGHNRTGLIHPDFKTEEEKRERKNARARALRAARSTDREPCGCGGTGK